MNGVYGQSAPATDTNDTDALKIDIFTQSEVIDCCTVIFGVDVGRRYIAGLSSALAAEGGVESKREEPAPGHRLSIKSRTLLLHCAVRAAYGNGWQFARRMFGNYRSAASVMP